MGSSFEDEPVQPVRIAMSFHRSSALGLLLTALAVGCSGGPGDGSEGSSDTETAGSDESGGSGAADGVAGETGGSAGGSGSGEGTEGGGDGSGSGAGDSGGGDDSGLDAVEAACEADCEAQFATQCTHPNQNELTCKYGCASVTVQLDGFCLDEYAQLIQCRADGGYDCVNDYPTPRSTCALEQQAFSECTSDLGCKRICRDSIEAGCEDAPLDTCVASCVADKAALPGYCGLYVDSLLMCQASLELICGAQATDPYGNCDYQAASIGDCIYDETGDACEALCYIADALSCGTDCASDCETRLADPTCGTQYAELIDCELLHGDLACSDGQIVGIDICESDYAAYQACTGG